MKSIHFWMGFWAITLLKFMLIDHYAQPPNSTLGGSCIK